MTNAIEPGDAGTALAEVRRRQEQVIDAALVPGWYWWVVGAASVGLGLVVDTRSGVAIGLAAALYALGVAVLTVWLILGGRRGVRASEGLLGAEGAGLIVGFVGVVVVATIGLAFALRAAGSGQPATVSTLACAAALVLGGPRLMRRLQAIMRRRPDDGR